MHYTRSYIENLKSAVSLTKLLSNHNIKVSPEGKHYKALCPFHNDQKTKSLSIDEQKGVYHCFGCDAQGDHITFLRQYRKLRFKEAVLYLSQLAGVL